jgi:uncharacterized protein
LAGTLGSVPAVASERSGFSDRVFSQDAAIQQRPPTESPQMSEQSLQFVMKISKYCNLRCTYCYEFNELGDKRRMQLESLRRMFENIRVHAVASGFDSVGFIWHGGEPFLIPIDYYRAIGRLQQEILGDVVKVSNAVQTNLTVLTDRHIDFLKGGEFFSSIGVSFDVYGDQRKDTAGRLRTDTILDNMQKLFGNNIAFGAITVLTRNTLPHTREIYRFYDEMGISHRFLAYYRSADEAQIDTQSLTYDELVEAYKVLFDEWAASDHATPVDPIDSYIDFAVRYLRGEHDDYYRKGEQDFVYLVNPDGSMWDGSIWGDAEPYDPAYKHGNLASDSFESMFNSPARSKVLADSARRIGRFCRNCPFFGACPGEFVANASPMEERLLAERGCPVRDLVSHIAQRLQEQGLSTAIGERKGRQRINNPALSVAT